MREILRLYADSRSLQLCRRGPWVISASGATYQRACDGRWGCPICSPRLLAEDREDIAAVLHQHHGALFLTFSISDSREPLARTLGNVLAVWSEAFTKGSWFTRYRERAGMAGWIRAVEITFSEIGGHPHIHAVFVFDGDVPEDAEDALRGRWMASADKLGHQADSEAMRADTPAVVPPGEARDKVAFYLTEQNAIRQSRPDHGRTPGDLLHSAALTGDADDLVQLREFHAATKGRHKVQWSRGLRLERNIQRSVG